MSRFGSIALGCALVSCLVLTPGSAQTTVRVVPSEYALKEGPSSLYLPFYYQTARTQCLYLTSSLTKSGGVLSGITFRRDGVAKLAFSAMSRNLQIDYYLTPVTPAAMTTSFAANRGNAVASTVYNQTLNLPAQPIPSNTPAPWSITITFNKPQPILVSQGNVLLEYICKGPGTGTTIYYLDGLNLSKTPRGKIAMIGKPCIGAKGGYFGLTPSAFTWVLGGKGDLIWRTATGGLTSILAFIGTSNTGWGPFKLPFDLAPMGGTSSTADACRLYTNILLQQVVPAKQRATFGPIPNNPALNGITLYSHGFAALAPANPLGVITGGAYSITIGHPSGPAVDVNTLFVENNLAATTGRFLATNAYWGPITKFAGMFN